MPRRRSGTAGTITANSGEKPARDRAEANLQASFVEYFALAVAPGDAVLFAVPNGERRDAVTAFLLAGKATDERSPDEVFLIPKGQGVLPGAVDLVLLSGGGKTDLIEVKRPESVDIESGKKKKAGTQSRPQKIFERAVTRLGHAYHLLDNLDDFADLLRRRGVVKRKVTLT